MNRRDPADQVLALALHLLPHARRDWGHAMRAELAHLREGRWRFALGCLRVALWYGPLRHGRLWRVAGCVAAQAVAVWITLASGLTGSFAVLVITLAVLTPPGVWWLGRHTGYFGQDGMPRVARIDRRIGYGLVSSVAVAAIGFMTVNIPAHDDGVAAATLLLGVVSALLAVYLLATVALTSARSPLPVAATTRAGVLGAAAGTAGFALMPFNQTLALNGVWAAVYPAGLALAVCGAPATAGLLAARRDGGPGVLAGGCAGATGALVVSIAGGVGIWLHPGWITLSIVDKGPTVLPPDPLDVAGGYLVVLTALPLIGAACGALGERMAAAVSARTVAPALVLLLAAVLCYPLVESINQQSVPSFGAVGATSVQFSTDGHALLTGADGGMTTSLWDLRDPNHPTRTASMNRTALFASNGHIMASEDALWDVTDPGRPVRIASIDGGDPLAYSPDARLLATTVHGSDTATLWNVTIPRHPVRIATVTGSDAGAFTPDDNLYAASSGTSTTLWSVTSGARVATVAGVDPVAAPQGGWLATKAAGGTVSLWNITDPAHPALAATLTCGADPRPMAAVLFSPDGQLLAAASADGTATLWRLTDLADNATLTPAPGSGNHQIGVSDTLTTAAFSTNGRRFGVVVGDDMAMTWDVTDPRHPSQVGVHSRAASGPGVVAFAPDLADIAGTAPDGDNAVALWPIN